MPEPASYCDQAGIAGNRGPGRCRKEIIQLLARSQTTQCVAMNGGWPPRPALVVQDQGAPEVLAAEINWDCEALAVPTDAGQLVRPHETQADTTGHDWRQSCPRPRQPVSAAVQSSSGKNLIQYRSARLGPSGPAECLIRQVNLRRWQGVLFEAGPLLEGLCRCV